MADPQVANLPSIPAYPPQDVIDNLPQSEWQNCLHVWISSLELRLRLTDSALSKYGADQNGTAFLVSYLPSQTSARRAVQANSNETKLYRRAMMLAKRILLLRDIMLNTSQLFNLASSGSVAFELVKEWKTVLKSLYKDGRMKKPIEHAKLRLESASGPELPQILQKFSALTKCLPETAVETMAGADHLETVMQIYNHGDSKTQRTAIEHVYYAFMALLTLKHTTMLTDNIWHIKSETDRLSKGTSKSTLLSSLVCTTSFLRHLAAASEIAGRQRKMIEQLQDYRQNMLQFHPPPSRPKSARSKGKQKASAPEDMHMHTASQISQIHDLFPDLSHAYIMKALDHFSNDVETVIAALLEPDTLPDDLKDRRVAANEHTSETAVHDLAPRPTPPLLPQRKSVFDNDAFDKLRISEKQLRRGKKNIELEDVVASDEHAKSKAAILAALASFDSDDDERDDTYDVADIGGAVDNTLDTDSRPRQPAGQEKDMHEQTLFQAWKANPEIFARDSKTRSSNIRAQLKRDTAMSDEQIEGWAIMLQKDPKMIDRLDQKYSAARAFGGNQQALQSTRWQASTDNSENEGGPEAQSDGRRIGQAGIRGHRDFSRGRGRGNTAGPSNDPQTQAARRNKEQGRGRGNHNRREGRAKKVGRGMGPLPQ